MLWQINYYIREKEWNDVASLILLCVAEKKKCFILWINTKKRNGNRKMKPYRSLWQQVQTRVQSYPLILLISRGIIDGWKIISHRYSLWSTKIYNTLLLSTMFSWIANLFSEKSIKKALREKAQVRHLSIVLLLNLSVLNRSNN